MSSPEKPYQLPANDNRSPEKEVFVPNYELEISRIRPMSEAAGNNILDDEMLSAVEENRPPIYLRSTKLIGARKYLYSTLLLFKQACEDPELTEEEYTKTIEGIIDFVKRSPEELRSQYGDD